MRTERAPYSTTLYLWKGVSAMFYSSFITPYHSHNTLQLVFTLRDPFRFRTPDTEWQRYRTLIIKEDCIHRLDTDGSVHLIVYVDAASPTAQIIRDKYLGRRNFYSPDGQPLHRLKPGELEQCLLEADNRRFEELVNRLLEMLAGVTEPVDHRVDEVIRLLSGEPETATIQGLAQRVYLSESRLRSLFSRATGVSLHRYIIIKRISLAMEMIMNGSTISEAAAGSGFTDGSHLHRMLLQQFGISPSQFLRDNAQKRISRSGDEPLKLITTVMDMR